MAMRGAYTKDPNEDIRDGRWGIDWNADLNDATVSSVVIAVTDEDGTDVTSTIAPDAGAVVGGRYTTCRITAGAAGSQYLVVHRVTLSDSSVLEDGFTVSVLNNAL